MMEYRLPAACLLFLLFIPPLVAQQAPADSLPHTGQPPVLLAEVPPEAEPLPVFGVLTEEARRLYLPDQLPLSLQQRGRQVTTSVRGLPPGGLRQQFAGFQLQNPASGFWNEQLVPLFRIGRRQTSLGNTREWLEPAAPLSNKAESSIVFSQDYILDLNFLDINFAQRLSKDSYIQLAGSNYSGSGSLAGGFSQFQLNDYHAHWQGRLGSRWRTDFFYWQMRQRFNLEPEAGNVPVRDGFKQVGHLSWLRLQGQLGANDSLVITPGFTTIEDRLVREGVLRNNRYNLPALRLEYLHRIASWRVGVSADGGSTHTSAQRVWEDRNEWDGRTALHLAHTEGPLRLQIEGGGYRHSKLGTAAEGRAELRLQGRAVQLGLEAASSARPAALLWRSIRDSSIVPYTGAKLIRQDELHALVLLRKGSLQAAVEPFTLRTRNYPILLTGGSGWQEQTLNSSGIRAGLGLGFGKLSLENEATLYVQDKLNFSPRFYNVSTLKISLGLLNKAFLLDGIATLRYMDRYQPLTFNRILNLYQPGNTPAGPYLLADARLQSHFRDATIFFVWENLLRDDYSIVNDVSDAFLVFRLGMEWILFD